MSDAETLQVGKPSRKMPEKAVARGLKESSLDVHPNASAQQNNDIARRIWCALVAFALFIGTGIALGKACGLDLAASAIAIPVCIGLVFIVVCASLSGRGRIEMFGYAIMAAVIVVGSLVFMGRIADGGALVLNSLAQVMGSRTATYDMPFITANADDILAFICLVAAILAVVCANMALRGNVVLCTILAVLVVALVFLGFISISWWTVAFACGTLGCFIVNSSLMNHRASGRSLVIISLVAIAFCALLTSIAFGCANFAATGTSSIQQSLLQAVNALRYGGASYAMPEGQLHDLGASCRVGPSGAHGYRR